VRWLNLLPGLAREHAMALPGFALNVTAWYRAAWSMCEENFIAVDVDQSGAGGPFYHASQTPVAQLPTAPVLEIGGAAWLSEKFATEKWSM